MIAGSGKFALTSKNHNLKGQQKEAKLNRSCFIQALKDQVKMNYLNGQLQKNLEAFLLGRYRLVPREGTVRDVYKGLESVWFVHGQL